VNAEALLEIDMINDFLKPGAVLEVPTGREIIPNIAQKIKHAEIVGKPIIFVSDSHRIFDDELNYWPKHAMVGTNGRLLYEKLRSSIGINSLHNLHTVDKYTYSGFYGTDLDRLLKGYGVSTIFLTGILTNICIFITAIEAQMRGYNVVVFEDSVAALTQEENNRALEQLEKVFKIRKMT